MKLIAVSISTGLVFLSSIALAAPPTFNGVNQKGFVTVNTGATYMEGRVNVRIDPIPGHEKSYIYTHHYANNVVWFQGYDAVSNRSFGCKFNPGTVNYNQAVDMSNNMQDGARILVWRSSTSSDCTGIGLSNGSRYTH